MDEGYLAFSTVDRFLGIAFRGLKGQKLYPMISAVWGHCEVTMEYLGAIRKCFNFYICEFIV
jgi:SPRY domain-containing SOCS box protein 1/4